jgi:hypothetical protein
MDGLAADKADSTNAMSGTPTGGPESDHAGHHNALAAGVNAIQETLGVDPQGSRSSVATRIEAVEGLVEEAAGVELAPLATKGEVEGVALGSLKDYAAVDLSAAPYSVKPEADVTEELQAAVDALAGTAAGGWIYLPTTSGYVLSGELRIPARKFTQQQQFFGLKGVAPSLGGSTGIENGGLTLTTTATAGQILAVEAAAGEEAVLTRPASNVVVALEDMTIKAPTNPQVGGIDLSAAVRASLRCFALWAHETATYTGSGVALNLPAVSNIRGARLQEVMLGGFPSLMTLPEHVYADRLTLANAKVGIITEGIPNLSVLSDVHALNIGLLFKRGGAGGGVGGVIVGNINYENDIEEGDRAPVALIEDKAGLIRGSIKLAIAKVGGVPYSVVNSGLPAIGGRGLDIESVEKGGGGWRSRRPRDTFKRRWTTEGEATPGLCSDTFHPWRVIEGGFKITQEASNGKLQSTKAEGNSEALLPVKGRGGSRIIRSTFSPGVEKFNVMWRLNRRNGGAAKLIEVLLRDTGTPTASIKAAGVTLVEKKSGEVTVVKGGGPYKIAIKIDCNVEGLPEKVIVYVNGTELLSGSVGATERGELTPGEDESVPLEDGIKFLSDAESSLTLFEVADP